MVISGDSGITLYHEWEHPYSEDDEEPKFKQMYAARLAFNERKVTLL